MNLSFETLKENWVAGSAGCVAWTMNATHAETVNSNFDGKFAVPGGVVHSEHAK